ncbi:MAG: hypothetical protein IBX46_02290 [Desulfuromonadales bacterium]|nr:hypothetical protein [Desulfuromonadales bacterium]
MKKISLTHRNTHSLLLGALLTLALSLQGCVSYTSGYIPDPRTKTFNTALDRDAAQAGPPRLLVTTLPSAETPATPLAFMVSHTLTGPEANITTVQENTYERQWGPLIIPLGAVLTVASPIIISAAALSNDDTALGRLLGTDDDNPCEHGMFMFSIQALVGIMDSCDIVDTRGDVRKRPTGKTVSEEVGLAKIPLKVQLQTRGEEPIIRTLETDINGKAALDAAPLFRSFRAEPGEIEVIVQAQTSNGNLQQSGRIDAAASRRLFLPVAEERRGDQALAAGKGFIALDHFTRAYENTLIPADLAAIKKKVFDCYRSLPVKPPMPEEARRLIVQAETMALENDSERAIALLSEAIRKTPWLPTPRYNLAMAYAMNKDYSPAIESMNAYLDLAPEAADARKARDLVYQWEAARDKEGATSPKQEESAAGGRRK